jgi:hypothetical protein
MSSQGRQLFAEELHGLGFDPELVEDSETMISFDYVIPNGPRCGEQVRLGLEVPPNFPVEPPHGPHYRPTILRGRDIAGVHENLAFGPDWDHWSRPHPRWNLTDRSVKAYMRHLRSLNEELPGQLAHVA